jgi:DNA-binding NtrC family response regulator
MSKKMRILVADDNTFAREAHARIITMMGANPISVGRADAFCPERDGEVAGALVDLAMPPGERGGLDLAKRLVDSGLSPDRIVIISGEISKNVQAQCNALGYLFYRKPAQLPDLRAFIRSLSK